jgi:hypothetical protein
MPWSLVQEQRTQGTSTCGLGRDFIVYFWHSKQDLWGTASQSNIEIPQRLQNKILRMVTNAPRYVPNHVLHTDLQIPTIREEITRFSTNYKAKLEVHPNALITNLFVKPGPRRLRRYLPLDLSARFNELESLEYWGYSLEYISSCHCLR